MILHLPRFLTGMLFLSYRSMVFHGAIRLRTLPPIRGGVLLKLRGKWTRSDSNRQPSLCKSAALPLELQARGANGGIYTQLHPRKGHRLGQRTIAHSFDDCKRTL